MQRIISIFAIIFLSLSIMVVSFDANAKRFGGGRSFGKAPSHQSRQVTPNRPATQPGQQPTPGRSWMGPLAGLVAGGLLASLFMGGGFSGINFFDILILAVLAFLVFRFIRSRAQPQHEAANNPTQAFQGQEKSQSSIFGTQQLAINDSPVINAPAWFDEGAFVDAAKQHFMSLQAHWDANEIDKIAEYVTPDMLTFLKAERAGEGDGFQLTYIDNLAVVLDGVDDNPDKTVATLTFTGIAKTSRFDQGEPFNESWRMEREQGENKPWLVAGIRQNSY